MQRLFISNDNNFPRTIGRKGASYYKVLNIEDKVSVPCEVELRDVDGVMTICYNGDGDVNAESEYTILCKEFGLYDYRRNKCKVSICFLDDGWMLVNLIQGAIVTKMDGQPVIPSVGDYNNLEPYKNDIKWVDAEYIKSYGTYFAKKGNFLYDFQFMFEISGGMAGNCGSFSLRPIESEDIDLSGGKYAKYLQDEAAKEFSKKATAMMNSVMHHTDDEDLEGDDELEDMVFYEEEEDNN